MVDDGLAPETLDAAAVAFGMPMGPIELADNGGAGYLLAVRKELAGEDAAVRRNSPSSSPQETWAGSPGAASTSGRSGKARKGSSRGAQSTPQSG